MPNHVLLDNVTHKDLRINTVFGKGRGFDVNVTRVFPSEFARLQREYPLFLFKNAESGDFDAIALLGFEKGQNLYLNDGSWDATEIPLTIQRQPFLIGFRERVVDGMPQQDAVVHVDLDHPSVSWTAGERVFLPQGGESPCLERVNDILARIHQGNAASRVLSQVLVGLELVESIAVDVEFDDGTKQSLAGLYTINEDRLRGLGGNALEALHARGHLQDVFMLLASLLSMKGLIARKNRLLPGRRVAG